MIDGRLPEFEEHVRKAETDPYSERVVRIMLGRVAEHCPLWVALRLAQSLIECRREELRGDSERN